MALSDWEVIAVTGDMVILKNAVTDKVTVCKILVIADLGTVEP